MKYCTYIISHENGYFYIGKGLTAQFEKRKYWGSGRAINDCYKKYPREEWDRKILQLFEIEDEAYAHEGTIVTDATIQNQLCLNLVPGGRGNNSRKHTLEENLAKSLRSKGRKLATRTNKHKENISIGKLGKTISKPKTVSCPHCSKVGGSNIMKTWHFDNCRAFSSAIPLNRKSLKSRVFSKESLLKMQQAARKRWQQITVKQVT